MKISFTNQELNSVENLLSKIDIESKQLVKIMASMEYNETLDLKPSDFSITGTLNKEYREKLNADFGHVLTITKFEDEYQLWLCEEFFTDSLDLYGDGIVEIFRGLQGIAKSMLYFVKARFMPFLEKWKLN